MAVLTFVRMLTQNDFFRQFSALSDAELASVKAREGEYSDEARAALAEVIESRGGLEALAAKWQRHQAQLRERARVRAEVARLQVSGDRDFLRKMMHSDLLPAAEVDALIDETLDALERRAADERVTGRTVVGSVAGALLGCLIGAAFIGYFALQTGRVFYFLGLVPLVLSYGFIRLFTKQSRHNIAVLVACVLATAISLALGIYIGQNF